MSSRTPLHGRQPEVEVMLLAIDPGKLQGWALFDVDGQLDACGLGAPPPGDYEAIIEHPVIYPHGRTPNPNDIVRLAFRAGKQAGALEAALGIEVKTVEPREWKGTINKDTCCRRVWSWLTPDEQRIAAAFAPKKKLGKEEHVLDAIGIGLHALGRLRR